MKKKKLLIATASFASLVLMGYSTFVYSSKPIRVFAEGEQPSTSEQSTIELPEDVKEEISYWKQLYNDFIVPLLGGVSISSIVAAAVTIAVSILKRKKDKAFIEKVDGRIAKLEALTQQSLEVVELADRLINSFEKNSSEVSTYLSQFIEKADSLLLSISDLCGEVQDLQPIRGQLATLTEVQGKIASHTKELVGSGVAEDIKKLLADIKEVEANGTKE